VAYASQKSWIFSGTVKQNILCGKDYNVERSNRVIEACALEDDISASFPMAILHVLKSVAFRSVVVKRPAWNNLAWALYTDADIYLLDDPLSAVDSHVGRHLFDKSINSFLDGKIRVLVTYQLHYLKDVDRILVLNQVIVNQILTNHIFIPDDYSFIST